MNGDTLRGAARVLGVIVRHDAVRDAAGDTVAGATTWGLAGFALLVVAALVGHRDAVRRAVVTATTGGVAAVVAAGLGLALKAVAAEPRPCQLDPSLAEAARCPAPGDWSFPSLHAVLAGAFAMTVVVIARSTARLWVASVAVTLALLVAVTRVVLGVHHWWDVLAGLALGAGVAAALLAVVARRATDRWAARGSLPRPLSTIR